MTFGQHLEEFRGCFQVGFGAGGRVCHRAVGGELRRGLYQAPASQALTVYYQKETIDHAEGELEKLKQSGRPAPSLDTQEGIEDRMLKESLLVDEVYVNPAELTGNSSGLSRDSSLSNCLRSRDRPGELAARKAGPLVSLAPRQGRPRVRSRFQRPRPFTIYVKGSLLVGMLLASPWIFYQIWLFVGAGLYWHVGQVCLHVPADESGPVPGRGRGRISSHFQPILTFLFNFR